MNKKFTRSLPLFILSFALLASCNVESEDNISASSSKELEEFKSINVSIASGDIIIKEGDAFRVSYDLHSKEKVKEINIENGIFTFNTEIDFKFKPDIGDFFLEITIPKEASLSDISLSTVAGDIILDERSFETGILKSVSGDIEGKNLISSLLIAKTTSGDVAFEGLNISNMEAETVSDDINLDGTFGNIKAKSVSGDIEVTGKVENEANISTVAGDIETSFPISSVDAKTVGKITYDTLETKGKLQISQGAPYLFAKSTSGTIEIK